jgi:hypothetical protein
MSKLKLLGAPEPAPEQPQYPALNIGFAPDSSIVITVALGPSTSITQGITADVMDQIEQRRREMRNPVPALDLIRHVNASRND